MTAEQKGPATATFASRLGVASSRGSIVHPPTMWSMMSWTLTLWAVATPAWAHSWRSTERNKRTVVINPEAHKSTLGSSGKSLG